METSRKPPCTGEMRAARKRSMRTVSRIGWIVLMGTLVGGCGEKLSQAAPDSRIAAAAMSDPLPAADARSENVQLFWQEFRGAVLADDRTALLSRVRFPFTTRGQSDDDPVISHDQPGFWEVYARLMAQDVGLSQPQTVRQLIENHPQPPPIALGGGKTAAVTEDAGEFHAGPLSFEKIGGRWYWVSAFEEE